ncbi:MAG: hypothetical protein WA140_03030 [Geobacteraceae bacterium]
MAERKPSKKLSTTNTKQEMLDAYTDLLKQLEEKREVEATPEARVAEKVVKQAVAVADTLTTEGIVRDIGSLKLEVGKVLTTLSDRLEQEAGRYESVKRAIEEKEKELAEIYEIQKAASSLAALIESQNQKREDFELEMTSRKETLTSEIEEMRAEWQKEKLQRAAEMKEQGNEEAKRRAREKEEFEYAIQRERQLAKDAFEKEKAGYEEQKSALEREIALRQEQADREFVEREQSLARQEQELADLRARVALFPKEMESSVAAEVKSAVEKQQVEAKYRLELFQKELDGEKNVLMTKLASLEAVVKEQTARIAKLNEQIEKSYTQVQEIAVKAVEGSASVKAQAGVPARQAE